MKAAARLVLVPALVLCAAPTVAADGAWMGRELLAPFPGTAADGGGRTTHAAPAPPGATAAGSVAPAAAVAAGEKAANAGADPAVPRTASDPDPIGAPAGGRASAGIGAPGDRGRGAETDAPAGGSRLLRVLAATPKAPPSPDDLAGGTVPLSGPKVFGTSAAAGGCPRGLLWRLLAGAAGEADALSALGIEREILVLCRERQEILAGLFEAEAALRELSAPLAAPAPQAATKDAAGAAAPAPVGEAARAAQTTPSRATLAAADGNSDEADPRAGDAHAGEPRAPRYAWFSIVGTAGALRAGVTDGSGVWFVREGDALPGGARIVAITGRPPGVRVAGGDPGGDATPLPYRAPPGDAR